MNQIDLMVAACILFGGWLGSLQGVTKNFISLAATTLGIGAACLYGGRLANPLESRLAQVAGRFVIEPAWAATASTSSGWQQSAQLWLNDLLWPERLKAFVAQLWSQLPSQAVFTDWVDIVRQAFLRGLGNVCAMLTIVLLVRLLVAAVANISLKPGLGDGQRSPWLGFLAGSLQSTLMIFLVLALLVPFLALMDQTALPQALHSSASFSIVLRLLQSFMPI